ncbi:MAG TPA: FkbM family methyltransferase [Vicinamibacterales bacterium]|nr:FkbM family methyltransferase [Vicinamibacterales bacterium]
MASNPALTPGSRLGHAWRVRSPRGIAIALVDGALETVLPSWWRRNRGWYAARFTSASRPVIVIDGHRFEFPLSMVTIPRGLAWLGVYETPERYAVARFLNRSLPVVELGGSAGVVACMTNSLLVEPEAHVVVEANPGMAAILERNRIANGRAFTVVNCAVAYDGDSIEFPVADDYLASSLVAGSGKTARVPAATLASLMESRGFSVCNLVCDIEGAEMEMVRREGTLLQRKVAAIVIEVHPAFVGVEAVAGLERDFDRLGFTIAWRGADVWYLKNRAL